MLFVIAWKTAAARVRSPAFSFFHVPRYRGAIGAASPTDDKTEEIDNRQLHVRDGH
jgi:hypothetical protein